MRLDKARSLVLILLMAITLPSVGPLMDHHFAERHPGHRHLGPTQYHIHTFDYYPHVHVDTPGGGPDTSSQYTALSNYDSRPAGSVVVVTEDMALESFRLFTPTSLFLLPQPPTARPKQGYPAPPDKPPPQHLL